MPIVTEEAREAAKAHDRDLIEFGQLVGRAVMRKDAVALERMISTLNGAYFATKFSEWTGPTIIKVEL